MDRTGVGVDAVPARSVAMMNDSEVIMPMNAASMMSNGIPQIASPVNRGEIAPASTSSAIATDATPPKIVTRDHANFSMSTS